MNTERTVTWVLAMVGLLGLTFVSLAVFQALRAGDLLLLSRHPLLGSGAASMATAALGAGLFLQLKRWR